MYTKSQRNGILSLLLIILVLQVTYCFFNFNTKDYKSEDLTVEFQKQIDSLKAIKVAKKKAKKYFFNPNYINDHKGYQLGMSPIEIDRLLKFREQNKFINSIKEFQEVTKVTDSLLTEISPYFKFPNWVRSKKIIKTSFQKKIEHKKKISTNDINKAIEEDFKSIKGIGDKLANRIIKYRKRLQGFSYSYQLYEVWGLKKSLANQILQSFKIINKPYIKKVNINSATFKEVLKTPYVDYTLCKAIFNYRDEVAEIQDISELKQVKDFPLNKYDRIILYLQVK